MCPPSCQQLHNEDKGEGGITRQITIRHVVMFQCRDVVGEMCMPVAVESCSEIPREICIGVPVTECVDRERQQCKQWPRETCSTVQVRLTSSLQLMEINIDFQESICRDVPVEMCELVDFTKCQEVPKKFCQDISYEECKQSPEEVCYDVPGIIQKSHYFISYFVRGGL